MSGNQSTPEDIESARQDALQELLEDWDDSEDGSEEDVKQTAESLARTSQPGTFNCHEAFERTHDLVTDASELMDQPSIISNPEWYTLAHHAHNVLFNLYQKIGCAHTEAMPDSEELLKLIEATKAQTFKEK
jgi:hypothetical protein